MQTPFVKMMSRISEIENYILKGLVLDEHGAWIPIADKKAVEEDFLAHLMAGQVLNEGRWVSIAEAKSARAPTEIATIATEMPLPAPEKKEPSETPDAGAEIPGDSNGTDVLSTQENAEFPPETKTIFINRPPDQASDPLVATHVDPLSGYAPETGAFTLETPDETKPAPPENGSFSPETITDESISYSGRTTTSLLLPTVDSWEQSARKRHMQILVFGSIGVILAGAAAIAILVIQLTR
jgi:hypothetical protein